MSELAYPTDEENARIQTVLDRLVDARLLVRGSVDDPNGPQSEAYIEPAHDALVLAWDKLLRWKKEAEEYLPLQRRLAQAAAEWSKAKPESRTGLLWDDDPRLPQVEETLWPANDKLKGLHRRLRGVRQVLIPKTGTPDTTWLNDTELAFVQASVHERSQFWRRILSVSTAVIVGLVSLTIFALIQRQAAVDQAQRAKTGELTARSKLAMESDPELSVMLASYALSLAKPEYQFETENTLRESLLASRLEGRYDTSVAANRAVVFCPDGLKLAMIHNNSTVSVHDTASGENIATLNLGEHVHTYGLAFGSGNRSLLGITGCQIPEGGGCSGGFIQVWDLASQSEVMSIRLDETGWAVDLAPETECCGGQRRLSRHPLGHLRNVVDRRTRCIPGADRPVFSPDGQLLAIKTGDDQISLWDSALSLELSKSWQAVGENETIWKLVFNRSDEIAVLGDNGSMSLWKVSGSDPPGLSFRRTDLNRRLFDAAFSPNGLCLAAGGYDQEVVIWDDTGNKLLSLKGQHGRISDLAFIANTSSVERNLDPCESNKLATVGSDGTLLIWNIGAAREYATLEAHRAPVEEIAFSPARNIWSQRVMIIQLKSGLLILS